MEGKMERAFSTVPLERKGKVWKEWKAQISACCKSLRPRKIPFTSITWPEAIRESSARVTSRLTFRGFAVESYGIWAVAIAIKPSRSTVISTSAAARRPDQPRALPWACSSRVMLTSQPRRCSSAIISSQRFPSAPKCAPQYHSVLPVVLRDMQPSIGQLWAAQFGCAVSVMAHQEKCQSWHFPAA